MKNMFEPGIAFSTPYDEYIFIAGISKHKSNAFSVLNSVNHDRFWWKDFMPFGEIED